MKLCIARIGGSTLFYTQNEYIEVHAPMAVEQMNEKKQHKHAMMEIESSLSYSKFDDIKD